MASKLSLKRIKLITGLPFKNGSAIVPRYSFERPLSVDESESKCRSLQHEDMKRTAQSYFKAKGWLTTDTHIGLNGHNGVYQFADFAIERNGTIILVECLTHWHGSKERILKKLSLDPYAPLWFVAQPRSARSLAARGYKFISLQPIEVKHYEGSSRIYLAWKNLAQKRNEQFVPVREAHNRVKLR
jgi:hypothetical protein